ncbi:putative RNA binding protein [Trypoxylus dichotomus]
MVSRYVTNGPVKQEGFIMPPPPPTHYRMIPPQRADTGFHVTPPQTYVPPPPNQTGNQGPAIRGMAPTGPPNQSSTPPNSDLKVQMSQSVNLAFVPQSVRSGTPSYFRPPPNTQPPRMPNHRIQGQQPVFPPQSTPFMQPMAQVQPIYCMSYYSSAAGQRPAIIQPQYFPGQTFTTIYSQTPQQTQPYMNYPYLPRGAQPQVVASPPQNLPQVPQQALPLPPTSQQAVGQQKKRRAKAIPIIDPESGKDKLDEIFVENDSHPASGESSARQTPQPPYMPNKEIQNAFNKQVTMVINQEKMDEMEQSPSPSLEQHIDTQPVYQSLPPNSQAVHISNRNDLVHSSKLQLPTKEFVPSATHINAAKEVTPVVSANVITAEVTINKQTRESPIKNRKPRDLQVTKEVKEPLAVFDKKEEYKIKDKEEPKVKEPTSPPVPSMMASTKEQKEVSNQREEKKSVKKEKVDQKSTIPPPVELLAENGAQQNSVSVPAQENGKAKQRNKDAQKQTQAPSQTVPSNHKPSTIPVPQTQPSKPNNKTNKMKELNMKGANKEGTDMDAFSDNTQPIDTVVVTNTNTTTNDTLTTNDLINPNDSNKKIESNDLLTIKSESKILPKKVDVTDIVKDVPKPFVAPVEPCDETDRIEYDNDKIVQAKNEANTKVNTENESNIIELRSSLPYKDDQWSPSNTAGKKVYDKDFLLALRYVPKSRKKPENLLDIIVQEDRGRIGDINRYPLGGKPTDFTPTFSGSNYTGKSMSTQRSTLPKRNSQQGKSGGNTKGNKSSSVIRSISVRGDVKLNESENAWKPARFISSANMSDDEKKTQELYKKVRGVLNKLTPQKFDTLLVQVRALAIDTKERLQGVIDLVFEKAVDEPNFSVAYALMCKELALMQVPANNKRDGEASVNFRKLLVTRCQMEFEKNSVDETTRNGKVKEIEECTDPEKKKELQLLLEEDDRRIRRKSVGNIRFIGELFKQQMLTVNIMMRCLTHLLENKEEESLECLCKLLSTIGKDLEEKKVDLSTIFHTIREIVDKKHGKISSRVRFMLQDVIDLRNSKWIPRRQDLNPKTIDQIQKEANDEQLTIQAMNAVPITPRKDDRSTAGSGTGKRGARNTSDQEGWSTATSSRSKFSVQSDKLKNKPPQIDEPLGSSQMFGTWMRGSNIKPSTQTPSTGNMYAALESIGNDVDKRSAMNYASKDPYHSKGASLERNFKHSFEDGRGSRSGSQHRLPHESQRSKPVLPTPQNISKSNPPTVPKPRQPPVEQIQPEQLDQLQRKITNILEEYLNDCNTVEECDEDIRASLDPSALPKLVSESYILVLERSKTARTATGCLFGKLIQRFTLSIDNYCAGLEEVLNQADDLTIDIPKIWDYLAEIIAPVINENAVALVRLHKSFDIIIKQGHAPKLLDPLFKLVIAEKGPNYLHSFWQNSGLSFSDFMEQSQVTNFIQENQLEFLLGGSNSVVSQSELTYEQIHKKLLEFFANDNSLDDILGWIEANIGDRVHEKQFVRTLATAFFENSIVMSKLKTENLRKHYSLLLRIIDGRLDYELECLYALQALINKLEHPQGILLSICGSLYDDGIFSHDCFVKWEISDNPAEQEGKGVALKQLTSFFTQLKEADEETSSTEDA